MMPGMQSDLLTLSRQTAITLMALACLCLMQPKTARAGDDDAPAEAADNTGLETALPTDIDWSLLNTDPSSEIGKQWTLKPRTNKGFAGDTWSWTRNNNPDGSSTVTIKQPLSPFWDTRIGADLSVVSQTPATSSDVLAQKIANDNHLSRSTGSAWAAITAPGLGSIWDKTAIEARTDPTQDQSKFSASMSKSIPFGSDRYALTLQNGYNVTQQTLVPVFGISASSRVVELDQSAKLGVAETGTSFIAGQTHSTADEKWLRRIGAEQKIFGDVTFTGAISETATGAASRSLTAGFKRSW